QQDSIGAAGAEDRSLVSSGQLPGAALKPVGAAVRSIGPRDLAAFPLVGLGPRRTEEANALPAVGEDELGRVSFAKVRDALSHPARHHTAVGLTDLIENEQG